MSRRSSRYVRCDLPAGRSGDWVLESFEVPRPRGTAVDARPSWAQTPPGRYTRLRVGPTVMMTDTYEEWWTQEVAVHEGCRRGGHVLITGLGLGLVVESMLKAADSAVRGVSVVERSADVIELVAPHLLDRYGPRLEIVQADAFDWKPSAGVRYTVGWHDIWPNPRDEKRWPEMEQLEDRFRAYCDWQGCWSRQFLEMEAAASGAN